MTSPFPGAKLHFIMEKGLELEYIPELNEALLIMGFEGWGNALAISTGMVEYLIRKLDAKTFGKIGSDLFYTYDNHRPVIEVQNGLLRKIEPPGGLFYTVNKDLVGRDLILTKALEPNLNWSLFIDSILSLCHKSGVKTIISLGSMYDNILHTETIISAMASNERILETLKEEEILPTNYEGPGAIHSSFLQESSKQGFEYLSLWCHCPYYLQGTTHFGLLSRLGSFLSSWGGFELNTDELKVTWKDLSNQIQVAIDKNPELQGIVKDIRKNKAKGEWGQVGKQGKVVRMKDFLKPK
ncbi:PAC2 family protein [Thermodesulfobacteriota bacterium]